MQGWRGERGERAARDNKRHNVSLKHSCRFDKPSDQATHLETMHGSAAELRLSSGALLVCIPPESAAGTAAAAAGQDQPATATAAEGNPGASSGADESSALSFVSDAQVAMDPGASSGRRCFLQVRFLALALVLYSQSYTILQGYCITISRRFRFFFIL